ncbi:MAG: molybdopterin converting factor, subunit 1 [Actinomycetia bacterium]|nr:molybdopterin converting factor, subunit 1 [Actinomycetes bacterium]
MARITIRYWAAAKDAAGTPEEVMEAATLAAALAAALAARPGDDRLRQVMARSSFLVNALPVHREAYEETVLEDGATIEVLPPFAGG